MSKKKQDIFTRFSSYLSSILGRPWAFVAALGLLVIWALSGPLIGFGDTWQLIINTSTTIITFLMVFIIQNTQNRDSLATQIKLDAMMEKMGITRNDLIEAEEENDKKLEKKKKGIQAHNHTPNSKISSKT